MDASCKQLCDTIAEAIVREDYAAVRAQFAPWLRDSLDEAALQDMTAAASEGLEYPPQRWSLDEGMADLEELRKPGGYGPPRLPMAAAITPANFRGWLCIQFAPDPEFEDDQNVCFDVWIAAVEHDGRVVAGYFEATEAT